MPSPEPSDEDLDTANWQLNDGLRSCRAVVSNYRALLSGEGQEDVGVGGFIEGSENGEQPSV